MYTVSYNAVICFTSIKNNFDNYRNYSCRRIMCEVGIVILQFFFSIKIWPLDYMALNDINWLWYVLQTVRIPTQTYKNESKFTVLLTSIVLSPWIVKEWFEFCNWKVILSSITVYDIAIFLWFLELKQGSVVNTFLTTYIILLKNNFISSHRLLVMKV